MEGCRIESGLRTICHRSLQWDRWAMWSWLAMGSLQMELLIWCLISKSKTIHHIHFKLQGNYTLQHSYCKVLGEISYEYRSRCPAWIYALWLNGRDIRYHSSRYSVNSALERWEKKTPNRPIAGRKLFKLSNMSTWTQNQWLISKPSTTTIVIDSIS